MGFIDIFDEIVQIMHEDYAGAIDKKGADRPDYFRERLFALEYSNQLSRSAFEDVVREYLLDFKDDQNVLKSIQTSSPPKTVGFKVRRYENRLYIVDVMQENRLEIGAAILTLDHNPIQLIANTYCQQLNADHAEREDWSGILLKAVTCDVVHPCGKIETLELKHYPQGKSYENTFKLVDEEIPLLTIYDFLKFKQMKKWVSKYQEQLESSHQMIIDVRKCVCGSELAYLPLLNYLFRPDSVYFSELILHNMTERNYRNRIRFLKKYCGETGEALAKVFIKQMKKHPNQGFISLDFTEFQKNFSIQGIERSYQIVILTDFECAHDQFVLDSSQSPKVTLIGRPTRGLIDYSHRAIEIFEEEGYEFYYATAKDRRVDMGECLNKCGVSPHIYVPWTPEHLEHDIDLEQAIKFLSQKRFSNV